MPNGDGDFKPSGGPFIGGFGAPGVRESRQVNTSTEERIPLGQAISVWLSTLLVMFLGYLCLKMLITTRGDWSLLIGIVSIPAFPLMAVYIERRIIKRYFPRAYADFLNMSSRVLMDENFKMRLLWYFVFAVPILVALGFYINIIVPNMIIILQDQAHIVFVFCAFASLLVAYRVYYAFNVTELSDTLRNSDSAYAKYSLQIENENKWKRIEREEKLLDVPVSQQTIESELVHPVMLAAPADPTAPMTEAQERFKLAVFDFLDGIDAGLWDTQERSWRNDLVNGPKILAKSRIRLMSIGKEIRDQLIEKKWAEWRDSADHSTGWRLLFSTKEIREGAFQNAQFVPFNEMGNENDND